jgi:hypothetical protein
LQFCGFLGEGVLLVSDEVLQSCGFFDDPLNGAEDTVVVHDGKIVDKVL